MDLEGLFLRSIVGDSTAEESQYHWFFYKNENVFFCFSTDIKPLISFHRTYITQERHHLRLTEIAEYICFSHIFDFSLSSSSTKDLNLR